MSRVPETEDSSRTRPVQRDDPQGAERAKRALKQPNQLWNSFATDLVESGYDIRTVQELRRTTTRVRLSFVPMC